MEEIIVRPFRSHDAAEVSVMIRETLHVSNRKDYSQKYIESCAAQFTEEGILRRASWTHFYVACLEGSIIGCGAIGPYWGSVTESSLFTIFVLPQYQGRGAGRRIVETLEQDDYFLRAGRIEVPAALTARGFYEKLGYVCKPGVPQPDGELLYRMEKFR